ncbi:MFS transporter [Noviherbaspirillum saxi]|uniref:MFS transporter n=1 Tax=Noviherbaspirillum saxi TaxID=2320863 RepID=A0A3A3GAS8_9BURK|nr:MFS transporter [Noviherbaspirillum saxi]RJF99295.1 MFS transporter [Noviherbaspirillum saxi]
MNQCRKNTLILSIAQALLLVNNITLISINGLLGFALAADKRLATLPVMTYVIGAALSTIAASSFMKHYGRRAGFTVGSLFAVVGVSLGAVAVLMQNFWLLCAATLVSGVYNAFGKYYRFAAADTGPADFKSTAISLVLAGGIVGGVLGPEASKITRDLTHVPFFATYIALILFALFSLAVVRFLDIPQPSEKEKTAKGRPLHQIMRQPTFIVAVLSAAVGYGVMNLMMSATPLAMDVCGLPFNDAALVLQCHVIGMYAPSFFTGSLIKRFGVLKILIAGLVLMFACVGVALSGTTFSHFWWSLAILGVAWNFLYIGGTTLLTESYDPAEKAAVQGINDFLIFGTTSISALASGIVITSRGWASLATISLPLLGITMAAVLSLAIKRRFVVAS